MALESPRGAGFIQDQVIVCDAELNAGVSKPLTEAEIIDASIVEEVEGWDKPPAGVKVKKNPDPPPKFIPA